MPNGLWIYHTSSSPCPVCRGTSDCRSNSTGGTHCRRGDESNPPTGYRFGGKDKSGFGMFWPEDGRRIGKFIQTQIDIAKEEEKKARDARAKADRDRERDILRDVADRIENTRRDMTITERAWLAFDLCLPTRIFDLMPVQYYDDDGARGGSYVIPERDGDGRIVGWGLRYHDGVKRTHGKRGLLIPEGWAATDGPVVLPEGMSDTLALTSLGMAAVGRPSNLGGVEMMGRLLIKSGVAGDESRQVIVLGENDRKPDGSWPGRDGAEKTAARLAEIIGRPVRVAYPPAGYKDVRDYVTAHKVALIDKRASLKEIGFTFAEHVTKTAIPFGDYRQEMTLSVIFGFQLDGATSILPLSQQPVDFSSYLRPELSEIKQCPNARGVILRHDEMQKSRLLWADCKRLTCSHCGPIKRMQYQCTVTEHIHQWEKDGLIDNNSPPPKLWLFWCEDAEWKGLSNCIRKAGGEFFRLDIGNPSDEGGNLLIVTTVEPPAKFAVNGRFIHADEAIQRLCQAIHLLPALRPKVFTSSAAWKLVSDTKETVVKGWKRVGAFRCTRETCLDILDSSNTQWEVVGKRGRFWGWVSWQFDHAGVNVDHVYNQVFTGQPMPEFDAEWIVGGLSAGEAAEGMGWSAFGNADADEPAPPTFAEPVVAGGRVPLILDW